MKVAVEPRPRLLQGARVLEAYPVDRRGKAPDDSLWFGTRRMYEEAGFEVVARRKPTRPVMMKAPRKGRSLVLEPGNVSKAGTLCYLNVDGRIRDAVAQVASRGGKVMEPTHPIGPHGFRAVVLDGEGNRIALHSRTDA